MKDAINKLFQNWRSITPLGIPVNYAGAKSCLAPVINGTVSN